ncbi:MAG TPA: HlyD family efflux transporter periplasmic adaptor subunit [candidate division Zixibacteria bacterium]|nr:HlyD family efflux transporter periplasmic adaptor subunit [candidate division Zixibacteria bacterium]
MRLYPEFRQDLVIREHKVDGKAVYWVKDPVANTFFRFIVFQYYVATLLDGTTSLEEIGRSVSARMGLTVGSESIETFVKRLDTYGLLETSTAHEKTRQRSLLHYTIPLINPQRMIEWLYARLSWCFTRTFVLASILWVGFAVWLLSSDWEAYTTHVGAIMRLTSSTLVDLYILSFLVITIHEFAHALACRHFGGKVQDMGFILIFFLPGLYTNVSDSYLFERKRDRMIVMLVGMYSGILIGATAAIIWRITDPTAWIHQVSLMLMMASLWGLLFNLNPLIKLDGYYILNDWFDMPNLRRKAITYVKRLVRSIAGYPVESIRSLTRRQRRIYAGYGVMASIYSLGLIGVIMVFLGEIVLDYVSEFILAGLVVGFATAVRPSVSEDSSGRTEPPDEPVEPPRRPRFPKRTILLILSMIGFILILIFAEMELRISVPFRLRAAERAVVRAEISGQIDQIYVNEGDTVVTDQVLVHLVTRALDSERRTIAAQIVEARAQLSMLERGVRPEELDRATAFLQQTQAGQEAARLHHERTISLAEQNMIPQKDLDVARTDLALKQAEVAEATSALKLLQAGTRREEIEAKQAYIQTLKEKAAYTDQQIALCDIPSPIAGLVTTPYLKERRGEYVEIGEAICELIDYQHMIVDMAVPEREMEDIQSGHTVVIKLQGYPSSRFEGTVATIAPVAEIEEGRSVIHVRSALDNDTGFLKVGMTGIAWIQCGPRPIGAIMLRRMVRYVRTEFWW